MYKIIKRCQIKRNMEAKNIKQANEIIDRLIKALSLENDSELARDLGLGRSAVSVWRTTGNVNINRLFKKYEQLREEWILTGKGNMLKSEGDVENSSDFEKAGRLALELFRTLRALDDL
jgi:hypothetical protein